MIAIGTKKLLQLMLGARTIGHAITMKQAWPIAPADLQNVPYRGCESPRFGVRLPQSPEQPLQPSLHSGPCALSIIMQAGRGAMHPTIGYTYLGPQGSRRGQPAPQDRLQAPEGFAQGSLFSTRSRR